MDTLCMHLVSCIFYHTCTTLTNYMTCTCIDKMGMPLLSCRRHCWQLQPLASTRRRRRRCVQCFQNIVGYRGKHRKVFSWINVLAVTLCVWIEGQQLKGVRLWKAVWEGMVPAIMCCDVQCVYVCRVDRSVTYIYTCCVDRVALLPSLLPWTLPEELSALFNSCHFGLLL